MNRLNAIAHRIYICVTPCHAALKKKQKIQKYINTLSTATATNQNQFSHNYAHHTLKYMICACFFSLVLLNSTFDMISGNLEHPFRSRNNMGTIESLAERDKRARENHTS